MYKQNEISVEFSMFNHMERPESYITPDMTNGHMNKL
jgi:hypothetical protein